MAMNCFVSLLLALLLVAAGTVHAANPSGYNVLSTSTLGGVPATTTNVTYRCTLTNEWTSSRHPSLYPNNPELSSPLIVSHSTDFRLWAPGTTATSGLKTYVENGSPDNLLFDLLSTTKVLDLRVGKDQDVLVTVQQTLPAIMVDQQHSFLTTVVPFDPSPDWFSGFFAFNTIDTASNTFFKSFTIEVFPWDAGTRNGITYSGTGASQSPFQPVTQITTQTIPPTNVFLDTQGTGVLPVASWTCQLSASVVVSVPPATKNAPKPPTPVVTKPTPAPKGATTTVSGVRRPAPATSKRPNSKRTS